MLQIAFFLCPFFDVIPKSSRLFYDGERVTDCCYLSKEKKDFFMTKQCHYHFLVNQEKAEKYVFRKSKKYRTLCSVALGSMVTAVVAWGGQVAQAD